MNLRRELDRLTTEEEFTSAVIELATVYRWRVFHPRPLRRKDGSWRTAFSGDQGFPDLVLCRPPRLIFAELKRETGRLGPGQGAWLEKLRSSSGAEVYLWRPSDWDRLAAILAHPASAPPSPKPCA